MICPQCAQKYAPGPSLCWNCRVPLRSETSNKPITIVVFIVGGLVLLAITGLVAIGINENRKDELARIAETKKAQAPQPEATQTIKAAATPSPTPDYAAVKKEAQDLLSIKPEEYASTSEAAFDMPLSKLRSVDRSSPNYKEAQKLIDQLTRKRSDIEGLGNKPEQSTWDGSVQPVKEYLRRNLNDYDSSEFVEWSPVSSTVVNKIPYWSVRLRLRAKNAFGAYIVRDTYYFIRGGQVVMAKGLD